MTNLEVLNRWIDAVNAGDLSVIDEVVGEQIVDHHLPPGIPAGREGVRQWIRMLCDSLLIHLEVQETVADGDRACVRSVRARMSATTSASPRRIASSRPR